MLKRNSLLFLVMLLFIAGCSSDKSTITKIEDLEGKKVGTYTGSEYDVILLKSVETAIPTYFNNYNDQISALNAGKIDGFLTDEPLGKEILKENSGLKILYPKLTEDSYAFPITPQKKYLQVEIDSIMNRMKNDGTLAKLEEKWFGDDESKKVMLNYTYDDSKGTIKFATVLGSAPFSYLKDNKIVGYDIETITYISKELGYKLEIVEMSFEGIIPALVSGKIDAAGCSIIVTEQRKKSVLFSEPNYTGGIVIVVRAE